MLHVRPAAVCQVDEDVDYDDVPYDDFDDEATMRELEALG